MLNGFQEKLLLITVSGVEAWRRDPHGLGQIVDRGSFVSMLPKQQHRPMQRGVAIKPQRPTRLAQDCVFTSFHSLYYETS